MAIPNIQKKYFTYELLENGKEIKYRPMTIGQQKSIAQVKADNPKNNNKIVEAVIQSVQDCVDGVNVKELTDIDFKNLSYHISKASDTSTIDFELECQNKKCKHQNHYSFDMEKDIKMLNLNNFKGKIEMKEGYIIEIKQPTISDIQKCDKKKHKNPELQTIDLLAYCIKKIYSEEEIFVPDNHTEAITFLESIDIKYLDKLGDFYNDEPSMTTDKTFKCEKCGHVHSLSKEDVNDFL